MPADNVLSRVFCAPLRSAGAPSTITVPGTSGFSGESENAGVNLNAFARFGCREVFLKKRL
jgi:hypothetical protein